MRKLISLLVGSALAVLLVSPASAYVLIDDSASGEATETSQDTAEDGTEGDGATEAAAPVVLPPTKRTESVYFHCSSDVRADNVSKAQGTITGWNTSVPTESVQGGAGCGNVDGSEDITAEAAGTPADQSESQDAVFRGTFTGNLNSLTVTMFRIPGPPDRALNAALGPEFYGNAHLKIDGQTVPLSSNSFTAVPVESNSGVTDTITFSITGLGLMTEEGNGTISRTIELRLDHDSIEANGMFVWDTDEVPSGITFNPTSLSQTVLTKA